MTPWCVAARLQAVGLFRWTNLFSISPRYFQTPQSLDYCGIRILTDGLLSQDPSDLDPHDYAAF